MSAAKTPPSQRAAYAAHVYDVVIVGGSLAGAAAAIHLAQRGRNVVIIEQHAFPRRKVCGEGLLPIGVDELDRLGLRDSVEAAGEPLRRLRFAAGSHHVEAVLPGQGIGVRRTTLDALLLDAARTAGVEVCHGTATRLLVRSGRAHAVECVGGHTCPGRVVIGADGLHSRIRRLAGLETRSVGTRYGAAAHGQVPSFEPGVVSVSFHDGYETYVTPVGGDSVNAVMLLPRPTLRELGHDPAAAIASRLAATPELAGIEFEEPVKVAGPFPRTARRAYRGNVVLAGDAAGFFDGVTGEGMGVALASARLCADAVVAHLETGSIAPFRGYDSARRDLVRNSTLLGKLTLALGSRPSAARMAIRNLARQPETFERLVAISGGALGLRALRPSDLLTMLTGR